MTFFTESLERVDLETYSYAGNLSAVRTLADSHDHTFFGANLYNLWLSALRTLSPNQETSGLPAVAQTEP